MKRETTCCDVCGLPLERRVGGPGRPRERHSEKRGETPCDKLMNDWLRFTASWGEFPVETMTPDRQRAWRSEMMHWANNVRIEMSPEKKQEARRRMIALNKARRQPEKKA